MQVEEFLRELHAADESRSSAELLDLLEQLCRFALDDDAQGVAVCSALLDEVIGRASTRPN